MSHSVVTCSTNIIENLPPNVRDIIEISEKIKVVPGIIVTRLQYKNLVPKSFGNKLKEELSFSKRQNRHNFNRSLCLFLHVIES
jgi:hypothetical protein